MNHHVPLAGPVQYPHRIDLPIEPYTLRRLARRRDDDQGRDHVVRPGGPRADQRRRLHRSPLGVCARPLQNRRHRSHARCHDRPIRPERLALEPTAGPRACWTASSSRGRISRRASAQRLALLQGLMDTDGYVDDVAGRCEFTSTNEGMADAVVELAASLGFRPIKSVGRATLNGVDQGPEVPGQVHALIGRSSDSPRSSPARRQPTRATTASARSTSSARSPRFRSGASRSHRQAACSSHHARSSPRTTARWAAWDCSSTRPRATSTRAGRAT